MINIYIFLWRGDILFDYGCYGFLVFVFRLWEPKKLLMAAGLCFILMLARENRDLYKDKTMIAKGEAVEKIDTLTTKLTDDQKEVMGEMQEFREKFTMPSKIKRMEKTNRKVTGTYGEVYTNRTDAYLSSLITYTYMSVWDVISFMLLGMAFFKMGILTGKASIKLYTIMCVAGLGLGLLVSYYQLQPYINTHFNYFEYLKQTPVSFYEVGRLLRSLGFLGLLMLLYRSGVFNWFFAIMRPVGQMAFTNYLSQSIFCAVIFYGIGFGLFGKLQRYEAYTVVLSIWLFQIIFSNIWMRYFLYGPFEWLWRSLTYWKKQPFKRSNNDAIKSPA
ncbi:DUF418 domain-containing protein [Ferruginibacter sp.]